MTVVTELKLLKGLGHFYINAKMVESPSLELLKNMWIGCLNIYTV